MPARSPRLPTFLLGVGLGAFIDGIVIHQLLQWHHMLTGTPAHSVDTVSGLKVNTLADGFFHAASWLLVVLGLVLVLRAWRQGRLAPPWRMHLGLLLSGWGTFNIIEGLIDHQLLGIHHVRDDLGGPLSWDLGFLALSAVLVLGGLLLVRSSEESAVAEP